jgi:hypothetical protein
VTLSALLAVRCGWALAADRGEVREEHLAVAARAERLSPVAQEPVDALELEQQRELPWWVVPFAAVVAINLRGERR